MTTLPLLHVHKRPWRQLQAHLLDGHRWTSATSRPQLHTFPQGRLLEYRLAREVLAPFHAAAHREVVEEYVAEVRFLGGHRIRVELPQGVPVAGWVEAEVV